MSDVRWEGLTHDEIYAAVHQGPGPAISKPAEDAWKETEALILRIDQRIAAAMAASQSGWEGGAADATRSAMTPLGQWALDAARNARLTAGAVTGQGLFAKYVRDNMPEPLTQQRNDMIEEALNDPTFLFHGLDDLQAVEQEAANRAARAVELMNGYTENSEGNRQFWVPATFPPQVTVVTDGSTPSPGGVPGAPPPPAVAPPTPPAEVPPAAPPGPTPMPPADVPPVPAPPNGALPPAPPNTAPPGGTPAAPPIPPPPATSIPPAAIPPVPPVPPTGAVPQPSDRVTVPGPGTPNPGPGPAPPIPPPLAPPPVAPGLPARPAAPPGSGARPVPPGQVLPPGRPDLVPPAPTRPGPRFPGLDTTGPDPAPFPGPRATPEPPPGRAVPEPGARTTTTGPSTGTTPGTAGPRGVGPGNTGGLYPPVFGALGANQGRERRRPDYLLDDSGAFTDDRWFTPPVITPDDGPPARARNP